MGIRRTSAGTARRLLGLALVGLLVALVMPMGRASAAGPQTVGSVTLTLTPSSIRADGSSTSTAKATVTDTNGAPVPLATVNFGTDKTGAEAVTFSSSSALTLPDGTASVTITSSKTVDVQQITASTGGKSASKPLTQFGPATTVTLTLNPTSIVANGSSTSTATATAKDANGTGVADENMSFTTSGDVSIGSVTNHGDGTYTATITSSKTADLETIKATASKEANLSGTAPLTETAGPATSITLQLSKNPITADGADTSTATATVKDANSNPVTNETVAITSSGDVSIGTVTGHPDGTYTATITASKTADTETITAKATKANIATTQKLTENPGNPASVTVTLSPSTIKADGGTSSSTATATVKDANGNLVKDETVTFKSSDAGQAVSATTNNGDGTYTATIKSSNTPGQSTITATTSKHATVSGTATLTQFSTANTTTLSLAPALIPADGTSHSTATATVKDGSNNPVANAPVNFSTSGDVTFSQTTVNTDANGNASTQITASTTPDQETITAVGGGHTGTATLTESGPATNVALVLQPSTVTANGTDTSTATATVTDAKNNPVPNETVTMTKSGDVTIGSVTNHGNGTYTATVTASKTADTETITATATKANKAGSAQLTETAGPASSVTVALNPPSITADGTSTSTATATVKDANGNLVKDDVVGFKTSGDASVGSTTPNGDGTYRATITASTTADSETITATDTSVNPSKSGTGTLTETPVGTGFHPLPPTRILDTRDANGGGKLQQHEQRKVQITGSGGGVVPASHVSAVVLNLTGSLASTGTFLTVYPSGSPPTASNLNIPSGRNAANLVTSQLAPDGSVQLYNDQGSVHAILDVVGYYDDGSVANPSHYSALNPARIIDTRLSGGKLGPQSQRQVQITGQQGVPTTHVKAVVLNLTGTEGTAGTFLTVFPSGTVPNASNINLQPGENRANLVTVPVAPDGSVQVYNDQGSTHFILDVAGYFDDGTLTTAKGFTAHAPVRILDTRNGFPVHQRQSKQVFVVGGSSPVPAGATAVVINVTGTQATDGTFLTVYPSGQVPTVSNVNVPPNTDIPNLAVATLASDGSVQLYNDVGDVHVIFDVVGWFK